MAPEGILGLCPYSPGHLCSDLRGTSNWKYPGNTPGDGSGLSGSPCQPLCQGRGLSECPRPLMCRHLGYPSSVFAWSQQGRLCLARWKCYAEAQPPASGSQIWVEGKVQGNAWLPGKAAQERRGGRLLAEAEATMSGVICSPLSLGLTRRSYS